MTRILTLDGAITDTSKPILVTLESLEAQITALTPRAWWDASNAAYRSDIGGSSAVAVGSSSGTALTLTGPPSVGAVAVGQAVTGAGVTAGTYVVSGSGLSWVISPSQTIPASTTLNFAPTCSQLTDRTGNTFHLQQATQANRPPISPAAWTGTGLPARDAVTFDHVTDYKMQTAGNVFDATTVWTMVLICRALDPGASPGVPYSLPGANRFEVDLQTGGLGWRTNANGPPNLTAMTGNVLVVQTYNYPGSGNVTDNLYITDLGGATVTRNITYALGATSPASSGLVIGRLGGTAGFGFKGAISEMLAIKADLSSNPTALALLQQYFQMKYRVA